MAERAVVFDKAAWHLESVREQGLPDHQAFVHGGLFFGWAVDRGLHAPWLEQSTPAGFDAYRRGTLTGPQLLSLWDGAILDDMFADLGLAFVVSYFDPKSGAYFGDYIQGIAKGLPSEFHVPDDAASAARVKALLDRRFDEWHASWDPKKGRPDLRSTPAASADAPPLPEQLELGMVVVTAGVVLPGGLLGVRVARPSSVVVVERARKEGTPIGLLGYRTSKRVEYAPGDLLDTGVVAEIQTARIPEDRPDVIDVTLGCLVRFEIESWVDEAALRARVQVLADPEPTDTDISRLEEVRHLAAAVVRKRGVRGEPPGLLALAATHGGAPLLDVVARELPLSRAEALIVLEAPDLPSRLDVVLAALTREL